MLEPEDGKLNSISSSSNSFARKNWNFGSFQNHEFLSDKVHTVYSLQGGEKDYFEQ